MKSEREACLEQGLTFDKLKSGARRKVISERRDATEAFLARQTSYPTKLQEAIISPS